VIVDCSLETHHHAGKAIDAIRDQRRAGSRRDTTVRYVSIYEVKNGAIVSVRFVGAD
jgi:hypothetical protein